MNMNTKNLKPVALAAGALMLGGIALSQSAFAMNPLSQGYQLSSPDGGHGDGKPTEGKCGEGKCGEGKSHGEGKCGEGPDANKDGKVSADEQAAFDKMDTNKDGKISMDERKAAHEGKCGEGKCGGH